MSEPTNDEELRAFVASKLGEMRAELAHLIATLNLLTPVQANTLSARNRHLLYVVIALLLVLIAILATHAAISAGWLGR
jgi:hypothetical protein